jgi:hypothetical protein
MVQRKNRRTAVGRRPALRTIARLIDDGERIRCRNHLSTVAGLIDEHHRCRREFAGGSPGIEFLSARRWPTERELAAARLFVAVIVEVHSLASIVFVVCSSGRSSRKRAVVKVRVRYASDVPELSENRPAGLVTASVIFLRPATCAGECKPGVRM